MRNKNLPPGYILLWVIIIFISILVIISHVGLLVAQGRWECSEYKGYDITKCPADTNEPCSRSYIKECVKEVWTRKVSEDEND